MSLFPSACPNDFDPSVGCPAGKCSDCYMPDYMNWYDALNYCDSVYPGARLAEIRNEDEDLYLRGIMQYVHHELS